MTSGNASTSSPGLSRILDGPLSSVHWIELSLFFAEVSRLAYFPSDMVTHVANAAGITEVTYLDRDGAQAYVFGNADDMLIVCRGTEPHEWNDLKADANALTVLAEVGRIHCGFKREVDDLWPIIEQHIKENQRPVWFTGHSLGAAMATICAGRCKLSSIPSNPKSLFTFGCPRVGNRTYIRAVNIPHYRWVHNNDIVTRIPPKWLGYKHSGFELYLDSDGQLRDVYSWQRSRDRFRGLCIGLFRGKLDYFSDHPIATYIERIRACWFAYQKGKFFRKPRVASTD
jgi:triacylglycerol lipase